MKRKVVIGCSDNDGDMPIQCTYRESNRTCNLKKIIQDLPVIVKMQSPFGELSPNTSDVYPSSYDTHGCSNGQSILILVRRAWYRYDHWSMPIRVRSWGWSWRHDQGQSLLSPLYKDVKSIRKCVQPGSITGAKAESQTSCLEHPHIYAAYRSGDVVHV